jgi:hypothetical protein
MDVLKQTMREDLEKKADDLSKQLDKILGFWCQTVYYKSEGDNVCPHFFRGNNQRSLSVMQNQLFLQH